MHTYVSVCMCTCTCTLPPELLLPLPLLGAPGVCCQQLLHHINEVDAVHDQCLQLQLQHMQLLLAQLKSLQVSACVPCGKRGIEITWLKHRASGLAVCGWGGGWGWGEGQGDTEGRKGSALENACDKDQS